MAATSRMIGIRDLKARVSEVLREVQETGAEFIITVRGKPIARLEPLAIVGAVPADGMGGTRGASSHWPELTWEDFVEAKQIWEPRSLDDE